MNKTPPYAKFLNLLCNLRKENPDPELDGCDEILALISIRECAGVPLKITDLVQAIHFGTGPTVHRKISLLEQRGLITVTRSQTDARAKILTVSTKGNQHLKTRSTLLKQCLEG